MSSRTFTGFTEEDIDTIRKGNVDKDAPRSKTSFRTANLQTSGRSNSRDKIGIMKTQKSSNSYTPVPPGARLSQPKEPESSSPSPSSGYRSPDSPRSCSSVPSSPMTSSPCKSPTGNHPKNVKIRLRDNNSYEVISTNSTSFEEETAEDSKQESEDLLDHGIGEDSERGNGDEASLEKFEKRQKLMEEQNRRRREILSKAIADRSRRTQSEAQKLKQIQAELAKLDTLLSTDVSILRDQIEVASLEFNEAQKRYDRSEKEFIEAKLQLFNRLEKKELLTEHLCRIIEANELRKANKLSELMAKLEMVDIVNDVSNDEEVLPQLAGLDEVTYAACTTLKDPKKNTTAVSTNLAISNCDNIQKSTKENGKIATAKKEEDKDLPKEDNIPTVQPQIESSEKEESSVAPKDNSAPVSVEENCREQLEESLEKIDSVSDKQKDNAEVS